MIYHFNSKKNILKYNKEQKYILKLTGGQSFRGGFPKNTPTFVIKDGFKIIESKMNNLINNKMK